MKRRHAVWLRRRLEWALLRAAWLLVPAPERAEWWREWQGEWWHVRQACAVSDAEVTAFCCGALSDAWHLRWSGVDPRTKESHETTPAQCLLMLTTALAAVYALALLLPGVRAERSLGPRRAHAHLAVIEGGDAAARVPLGQFQHWRVQQRRYFDQFAFYRVTREAAETAAAPTEDQRRLANGAVATWNVAHASPNLFTLLGLPLAFTGGTDGVGQPESTAPQVILSERLWMRAFGPDREVAGATVRIGTQSMRISGVVPDGSLRLPGAVDAWVLDASPDASSADGLTGAGYVLAHLTPEGAGLMWRGRIDIDSPDDSAPDLVAVTVESAQPSPMTVYLFGLFLALVTLPAITSVSMGEAGLSLHRMRWPARLKRSYFLLAELALLLPIVYFTALDLACANAGIRAEMALYVQLAATFATALGGLSWLLRDQRRRCPVCLHTVTHPAQVGQASRTFLDWNGTEMMCMGGHTLLHVPSLPTSWFGAQRWLYLDGSWDFLFAGSTRPTP